MSRTPTSPSPTPHRLEDEAIRLLYCAAAGLDSWERALRMLALTIGAKAVALVAIDKRNGARSAAWQRWVTMDEDLGSANLAVRDVTTHPPRQTTLVAEDARTMVLVQVVPGVGHDPDSVSKALQVFQHHIATVLRIARHLHILGSLAGAFVSTRCVSAQPTLVLGPTGEILSINPAAEELLSAGSTLYIQARRLRSRQAAVDKQLAALLAPVASPSDKQANTSVLKFEDRASPHICTVQRLQKGLPDEGVTVKPAALLKVVWPVDMHGARLEPAYVASLFDLTPAESRVAVALVSGMKLKGIAKAHRTSIETVRSQLKAVYGKTGTRRQSQVVGLLLASCA